MEMKKKKKDLYVNYKLKQLKEPSMLSYLFIYLFFFFEKHLYSNLVACLYNVNII